VVLEAMAHGLPVIVTDTGATREQVDESNGFVIAKKSPEAIADAVLRFLNLPAEKRQAMSDASVSKVNERFTWAAVARRHAELFRALAPGHG
jgi:glycosyltransferase involved in cell wall biosynthesis